MRGCSVFLLVVFVLMTASQHKAEARRRFFFFGRRAQPNRRLAFRNRVINQNQLLALRSLGLLGGFGNTLGGGFFANGLNDVGVPVAVNDPALSAFGNPFSNNPFVNARGLNILNPNLALLGQNVALGLNPQLFNHQLAALAASGNINGFLRYGQKTGAIKSVMPVLNNGSSKEILPVGMDGKPVDSTIQTAIRAYNGGGSSKRGF